jgi:protein-disulfide isomerase
MLTWRAAGAFALLALLNAKLTTCRSPGEAGKGPSPSPEATANVDLAGVDTSELTAREKREWSGYVGELLAPCADQPVSIAQCVKEARDCKACLPAARFLVKRVQRGNARSQVEAAFRSRFAADQVKSVDLGDSPSMGPADAPVTIVEWADFECPFCGRAAPELDKLVKEYPGKIRLVFKNYPLSMHPHSEDAARAAMAAGKQGKFWEMHHALFQNQAKGLDKQEIERLARGVGLDMKKFKADWESEAIADRVSKDRKQGDKMELDGTPLIFIDGRRFNLEQFDLGEDLTDWIKLEVQLKTGAAAEPVPVKEDWPMPSEGEGEAGEAPAPSASIAAPPASVPAPPSAKPAPSAKPPPAPAPAKAPEKHP